MNFARWTRYLMLVVVAASTLVLLAPDAEARRLGGGKSFGKSSSSIFNRSAAKPPQNASAGNQGQAAAAGRGGMMGPIAGLAAGLGLAALASYMGFGEELANLMMILLLVFGGLFLFRFIMGRMAAAKGGGRAPGALAPAGNMGALRDSGNADADKRGSAGSGSGAAGAVAGGPVAAANNDTGLPAGFDVEGFVRQAKVQFVRLQAVYDAGDLKDLAEFTSPEVFAELKLDINERGTSANQTDVVTLNAELLGVDDSGPEYIASVQFNGMIREDPTASAQPFDESWTMTKPRDGSGGWVLAGIHQNNA